MVTKHSTYFENKGSRDLWFFQPNTAISRTNARTIVIMLQKVTFVVVQKTCTCRMIMSPALILIVAKCGVFAPKSVLMSVSIRISAPVFQITKFSLIIFLVNLLVRIGIMF